MEREKEKIEEIWENNSERHKDAAVGLGLVLFGVVLTFGLTQTSLLNNLDSNPEETNAYHKEVIIKSGITPYQTKINDKEIIKFRNMRDTDVNITFETKSIDTSLIVKANSSSYFDTSNYGDMPHRNYYSLESGSTGKIIVQ